MGKFRVFSGFSGFFGGFGGVLGGGFGGVRGGRKSGKMGFFLVNISLRWATHGLSGASVLDENQLGTNKKMHQKTSIL